MGDLAAFLMRVSMNARGIVPPADAANIEAGATHIPQRVTDARRSGLEVEFVQEGDDRAKWYWALRNGWKIYHGD